jgi:uncharacterized membrane protein
MTPPTAAPSAAPESVASAATAAAREAVARWRLATLVLTGALIVLGVAWETFLAPLRPGGSLLVFKVLPLLFALLSFRKDRVRHYQLWSMLILAYLCEGVVRGMSDGGRSSVLGWIETLLATAIFFSITRYIQSRRKVVTAAAAPGSLPGV